MRLAGVVLLVLALNPAMHALATKISMLTGRVTAMNGTGISMLFQVSTWTRDISVIAQIMVGLYFLLGGKWVIRILFRGLGGKDGLCPHCDYDVRGITTNRCPECGKLIRPVAD